MQLFSRTILPLLLFSAKALTAPAELVATPDHSALREKASLSARNDIDVGQGSGMDLEFFTQAECNGIAVLKDNVAYGSQFTGQSVSYRISRDMQDGEVLEFAVGPGTDWQDTGMEDGSMASDGSYTGPGYGTPNSPQVPSACDTLIFNPGPNVPRRNGTRGQSCYTISRIFNCARFWKNSAPVPAFNGD